MKDIKGVEHLMSGVVKRQGDAHVSCNNLNDKEMDYLIDWLRRAKEYKIFTELSKKVVINLRSSFMIHFTRGITNPALPLPTKAPSKLRLLPTCCCPEHVVDPGQLCEGCQAEYVKYLDEQSELAAIQERYENSITDR